LVVEKTNLWSFRCNKKNEIGVFNPWQVPPGGAGAAAGGGAGRKGYKPAGRAEQLVKGIYAFFNCLIAAVCGSDELYEATEVSLLESLPGCPRQAGHADYPIDVLGSCYLELPHFSLLIPACSMPAHLWLWPGSHRLMEQVLNSNSIRGHHAGGADFYIGSLQGLAGMRMGETIAPVNRVVGGGQACAFLGHVVHAGAESHCATCSHYRWHCYVQRKGTSKENNSANGLPRCVAALCTDSLRMASA